MKKLLVLLLYIFLCGGCAQNKKTESGDLSHGNRLPLSYAKGFTATDVGHSTLVEVTYPFQGATQGFRYLLVPVGETPPAHDENTTVVRVPLHSIVCTSTTHIPLLDYLEETDKLIGFPTTDYVSSAKMRKRIDEGYVTDLGIDKDLNLERLALLKPAALMGYTMTSDYGQFRKIESLGIPVVINAEYLEHHPLGRAEWIKFMGLFFDKRKEADSIFRMIESNYHQTIEALSATTNTPTVMSGIVYGDAWFLPAGENYAAVLFDDAGYDYLWKDSPGNGFLRVSFETVYEKGHDADLWIGTGGYRSLDEIRAADIRYTRFEAYRKRQVYNYDARTGPNGGNEFLELGYLRPDLILKDLVKISHPDLISDHDLYFYRRLE